MIDADSPPRHWGLTRFPVPLLLAAHCALAEPPAGDWWVAVRDVLRGTDHKIDDYARFRRTFPELEPWSSCSRQAPRSGVQSTRRRGPWISAGVGGDDGRSGRA